MENSREILSRYWVWELVFEDEQQFGKTDSISPSSSDIEAMYEIGGSCGGGGGCGGGGCGGGGCGGCGGGGGSGFIDEFGSDIL